MNKSTIWTALGCIVLILSVLAYGIVNTNKRFDHSRSDLERGVACVLEQQNKQRQQTYIFDQADAAHHGYTVNIPDDLIPKLTKKNLDDCKSILSDDVLEVLNLQSPVTNIQPTITTPPSIRIENSPPKVIVTPNSTTNVAPSNNVPSNTTPAPAPVVTQPPTTKPEPANKCVVTVLKPLCPIK